LIIITVHYIPIKRDLTNLIKKTKWCLDNYEERLKISDNAYQFSKLHLTHDACCLLYIYFIQQLFNFKLIFISILDKY